MEVIRVKSLKEIINKLNHFTVRYVGLILQGPRNLCMNRAKDIFKTKNHHNREKEMQFHQNLEKLVEIKHIMNIIKQRINNQLFNQSLQKQIWNRPNKTNKILKN